MVVAKNLNNLVRLVKTSHRALQESNALLDELA
jgi:hypothetical protein